MRQSMTAFARAVEENEQQRISVEIKSLNHRFLEINLKIPDYLHHLELTIREKIQSVVKRGKVDIWINTTTFCNNSEIILNKDALKFWLSELSAADVNHQLLSPSWQDILSLPGVLIDKNNETVSKENELMIFSVFNRALIEFISMREREGEAIKQVLSIRLNEIKIHIKNLEQYLPDLQAKITRQLREKLANLKIEADKNRFEQELVYLLSKTDVKEETDRLLFHIDEAENTLEQEGLIGRRMDFLMQEFSREANTLGAKAGDNRLSQTAVELKVLIEQMREQVQNLA